MTDTTNAALDSWINWIEDLPLPTDFDDGVMGLQSFIRALAAAPPVPVAEGYQGPIEVGMEFVWMANTKYEELVTITDIREIKNHERRIWTKYKGGETWNDESRFREACRPTAPRERR